MIWYKKFLIIIFILITFQVFIIPTFNVKLRPQNQWQDSKIRSEQLLIRQKFMKNVFVGSSFGNHLKFKKFSKKVYNLSYAGGSSLTGLNLIKRNNLNIKRLYIEINILKSNDLDLIEEVSWKYDHAKFLLNSYNPITILYSAISSDSKTKNNYSEASYKVGSENKRIEYNKLGTCPVLENVDSNIKELISLIKYFKEKNIEISLVEIPTDKVIKESLCQKTYEKKLADALNLNDIKLKLISDNKRTYQTNDGQHLTIQEADRFLEVVGNEFY